MKSESQKCKSMQELTDAVEAASREYKAAETRQRTAAEAEFQALNKLNGAQKELDAAVGKLRTRVPFGSGWTGRK
jgi:hypothetical protein